MKIDQVKYEEALSRRQTILQRMETAIRKGKDWGLQTLVQDQTYNLKLIKKDVNFNLKDDVAYIDRIRQNYNSSGPGTEDQETLKAELGRMEKMYTYKINYLTIMSQFKNNERNKEIQLARLEKIYSDEIKQLEDIQPPPLRFRERTQMGYIRKMTRKAQRLHHQEIEGRKKVLAKDKEEKIISIKNEEDYFTQKVAEFLKIDQCYIPLIKAGVMLLPGNSRLAGIFPKVQSLNFNSITKNHRHKAMQRHARKLLLRHNLFTEKNKDTILGTGILPKTRTGCVCIMYIKEGHMKDTKGAIFRPVFGTSGIKPYGEKHGLNEEEIESNSYTGMGVPDPLKMSDIYYEKAVESLTKHTGIMQRLSIKEPSVQSRLYFLQTPEFIANTIMDAPKKADARLINQAKQNKIGKLEKWKPSNCAEPAIMTAIYQMYSRPADIYLSVPFEGELSNGKLLLKYTCARCALSEPAFMSPDNSLRGQRLTDMRLQRDKSPVISDYLFSNELIFNAVNKKHPYQDRRNAIELTVIRNQAYGFGHVKRGHDQVAVENTNTLRIKQILQDIIDNILHQDHMLM